MAEDAATQARTAQGLAQDARKAEEDRRLEAEQAGYQASTKALEADQALVESYLSQAENLRNLAQPGRQGRAIELLRRASGLKRDTDSLIARLGADSAGLRPAMTQYWREQQPRLRSEAVRWFGEVSLKRLYDTRFPVLTRPYPVMTSRSGLALSDDGKWLAYFRFGLDDTAPGAFPAKFVEVIEADTGRLVRSLKASSSNPPPRDSPEFQRMNALAFDGPDQEVLWARPEHTISPNRLVYLIERWSRITGKVIGTVTLPMTNVRREDLMYGSAHAGRLVFSADRKKLLSVPSEPGKGATVWDLAAAWERSETKPLHEFESDFTPEAFFPDDRRILGMTGSDIVVRDVTTGGTTKRWPMPDGLVSVMGNRRNTPIPDPLAASEPTNFSLYYPGYRLQPDAQSLWVSPDSRWVAAFGQKPMVRYHGVEMPTTVFLFEAASGQLRARIPIPDIPPARVSQGAPAPPLAFDAESHLLAVATTKSLCLFSVPEGTPLISEALPELSGPPPGQPGAMRGTPDFTMPTSLFFARGTNRLFAAAHPSDLNGTLIGGDQFLPSAANKVIEQVVFSWDVAVPKTRIEDHRHDEIVRAVKIDPRDRFVIAAGDDRTIRVWDRGGDLRWSVGYAGSGSLFPHLTPLPGENKLWESGSFDPTGAVISTSLPGRIEVWDAATGERRGSFASVLATSSDNRYLAVAGGDGTNPARELRILDLSRNAAVLSLPVERDSPIDLYGRGGSKSVALSMPRARFSPDSRFFVVAGLDKGSSSLLIANLAEARVVARLPNAQWAIGPAGKVLVAGEMAGGEMSKLRAYALATGRQIGEPISGALTMWQSVDPSFIAPDDRKMVLTTPEKSGPQIVGSKPSVWEFDTARTIPIPGSWNLLAAYERLTYFDASGTRLLISGRQEPEPANPRQGPPATVSGRHVIELWDLAGPRRLMSTADEASELSFYHSLRFDPRQEAFVTFHDPPQTKTDGIGAIVWETATGKVLGRLKGNRYRIETWDRGYGNGDYFQLNDHKGDSTFTSIKTRQTRAIPGRFLCCFGVPGLYTAVSEVTSRSQAGRTVGSEHNLTLTNLETGRTRAVLPGQDVLPVPVDTLSAYGPPLPGAFTPDGKRLATRGTPGLNVWGVETGKLLRSVPLSNAPAPIADVHFSPDGRRLVFNLNDRFRVLDIESGRLIAIDRPGHRAAIRAVDVSPDGTLVASAGDDAAVCLWEAGTGRFVAMLEEETEPIAAVAFSPDGRSLAARALAGRVRVWKLERARAGERITVVATPAWDTTSLGSAAGAAATPGPVFLSQGRLVAFGAGDGTISLRDTATGRVERILKPESGQAAVTALTARADGTRLASGDTLGIVRLWDVSAEAPATRLVTDRGEIRTVALAGNLLAVAGSSLDLWDVETGDRLVTLEADARAINCLELSPDGRILASGDDKKVTLRDLDELRRLMAEIELGW